MFIIAVELGALFGCGIGMILGGIMAARAGMRKVEEVTQEAARTSREHVAMTARTIADQVEQYSDVPHAKLAAIIRKNYGRDLEETPR